MFDPSNFSGLLFDLLVLLSKLPRVVLVILFVLASTSQKFVFLLAQGSFYSLQFILRLLNFDVHIIVLLGQLILLSTMLLKSLTQRLDALS